MVSWELGSTGGKDTQLTHRKPSLSSVPEESNQRSPTGHKQFPVMPALAVPPGVFNYSEGGGGGRKGVASRDDDKTKP